MNTSDIEVVNNDQVEFVFSLDEALAALGFGKFHVLVLAYAGVGSMAVAMQVQLLSFIGPAFKTEWGISSEQESLITTVVFGGMLAGSCLWGLISDNYGRRMGLLSVVVTSIFAFLSSLSPNYISLIIFRAIVGIGLGGLPVYATWFLEFVPVKNRGFWMVMFSIFWTIGTIFEAFLAWIIIPRLGWRWLLVVSSAPCFIVLLSYFLTLESPRYLCLNGRFTDLHNVLNKMAAINGVELPSGIVIPDHSKQSEEFSSSETTPFISGGDSEKNTQTTFSIFFTLFSPSLAKITLLSWAIFFGNTFSYFGVILMTSELSNGQSKCGSNLMLLKDSSLYKNVFITSLAELPGLILSAALVDKIGRQFSMLLMYSSAFIFLLPLMFHPHEIITISLLFGARMCIIGTYTVSGVYCPESYPTSVRATGMGMAAAAGRIGGMVCPLVAVGLVSGCHQMAAVGLFELVLVVAGVSVLFFPIETKGMQLTDTVSNWRN